MLALSFTHQAKANASQETPATIDDSYRPLETLARGLYYLETMYVDPNKVERPSLVMDALKGIVKKLDPHTMVMPSKAFEQLTIDTQGKFGGVGIIVSSERNKVIVISPIEGTPAFKEGIKAGDEIIAIDDKPVESFKPGQATEAMRGKPDSVLNLTIKRRGVPEPLEFSLVRKIIKVRSVRSADLGNNILYARISSFQDNTADDLADIIKKNEKNLKGLVLDLRGNPGGLLDQAVRISDMFIESGVIVSTVGRDKNDIEREFAHKRGTFENFPMIVLIDEGSASASEIVAGALQDHERALIVGKESFGKGSVQTLVSLPDNSGLKITVARYYTPKDRSIQAKGIRPDIIVAKHSPRGGKDKRKKESDLKGHIESHDLSDMAKDAGILSDIKEWPDYAKKDNQLVTAFTYLRGWGLFKRKPKAQQPTGT